MTQYKIKFVDGPLAGEIDHIEVLFHKITKHPKGGGKPISYYRQDDPRERLKQYRYSVKP